MQTRRICNNNERNNDELYINERNKSIVFNS